MTRGDVYGLIIRAWDFYDTCLGILGFGEQHVIGRTLVDAANLTVPLLNEFMPWLPQGKSQLAVVIPSMNGNGNPACGSDHHQEVTCFCLCWIDVYGPLGKAEVYFIDLSGQGP